MPTLRNHCQSPPPDCSFVLFLFPVFSGLKTRCGCCLQNLVQRLLDKDPEHRIGLQEAIQHPWVTLEGSVSPGGLDTPDVSSGNDLDLEVCWSIERAVSSFCLYIIIFRRMGTSKKKRKRLKLTTFPLVKYVPRVNFNSTIQYQVVLIRNACCSTNGAAVATNGRPGRYQLVDRAGGRYVGCSVGRSVGQFCHSSAVG